MERTTQTNAEWIANFPTGTTKDRATEALAERWIHFDSVEASEWIVQLPTGNGRDASTGRLVEAIHHDDPDSALQWAASIKDPAARLEQATTVIRHWSRFDSQSAVEAAEASGFSAEEIQSITER